MAWRRRQQRHRWRSCEKPGCQRTMRRRLQRFLSITKAEDHQIEDISYLPLLIPLPAGLEWRPRVLALPPAVAAFHMLKRSARIEQTSAMMLVVLDVSSFKCGQGCPQRGNLRAVICLFNACIEKVQLPVGVVVTLHGDCVDTGTFPN